MAENTAFAHGFHFGDYSGVIFYGPPANGLWLDRLAVSDCYITPLFLAILDSTWRDSGGESLPRLVSEWNTVTGWADLGAGIVPVSSHDAQHLAHALIAVTVADIAPHAAGSSATECLDCARTVGNFISTRLLQGFTVYLEND